MHTIFLIMLLFPILVKGEDDWQAITTGLPATLFVWLLAVAVTSALGVEHEARTPNVPDRSDALEGGTVVCWGDPVRSE